MMSMKQLPPTFFDMANNVCPALLSGTGGSGY